MTWYLVIVLLGVGSGEQVVALRPQPMALAVCAVEKERIAQDMRQAYPDDRSYRIECRWIKPRRTS